ncbi:MAG: protein translocase subunit SecF [Bradymonadales bacterium]|nr:MAG: protein translocase subunit SecF [Bradymonadales bacterium]
MFRLFSDNLNIPFLQGRRFFSGLSIAMCALSVFFVMDRGLNFGVDFAGGVQMVLNFPEEAEVTADQVRSGLSDFGISQATVQNFGTEFDQRPSEYIISFPADIFEEEGMANAIFSILQEEIGLSEAGLREFRLSGFERAFVVIETDEGLDRLRGILVGQSLGPIRILDVLSFGSMEAQQYEISFSSLPAEIVQYFQRELVGENADARVVVEKVDFVGARVGQDLKTAALLSIFVTILLVFIYIFLRFDLMYAPGVVVALGHDVLITVGLFALTGFEFDLAVVAALLTVAGYSINDTIVVYDRIRESIGQYKGKSLIDILNIAINQTMNRTVITSATTLMATVVLWVVGGPVIHSFAFALCVGILVGTYSSIFVAAPLVYWMNLWLSKRGAGVNQKKKAAVA